MAGNLVSPDDMLAAAKDMMLDGKEPETKKDWQSILNFIAYNAKSGLEEAICKLMVTIYGMPITQSEAVEIAQFQAEKESSRIKQCSSLWEST